MKATETRRARILFLVRVPLTRTDAFLAAYEQVRYLVAGGVPGHLVDQVCRSQDDPEEWLITSEWADLESFLTWERTEEHRKTVRPLRETIEHARSIRFEILAQTSST